MVRGVGTVRGARTSGVIDRRRKLFLTNRIQLRGRLPQYERTKLSKDLARELSSYGFNDIASTKVQWLHYAQTIYYVTNEVKTRLPGDLYYKSCF